MINRFTKRIGAERLQEIIEDKIIHLLSRSKVESVDVVFDPSFVKAWSIRHPDNSRIGFSDHDAGVGRNGCGYDLGYKLHLSVDPKMILPLAVLIKPANENEKKHAPSLIEKGMSFGYFFPSLVHKGQGVIERVGFPSRISKLFLTILFMPLFAHSLSIW